MKIQGKTIRWWSGNIECDTGFAEIDISPEEFIRQVIEQDKTKELLIELDAELGMKMVDSEDKSEKCEETIKCPACHWEFEIYRTNEECNLLNKTEVKQPKIDKFWKQEDICKCKEYEWSKEVKDGKCLRCGKPIKEPECEHEYLQIKKTELEQLKWYLAEAERLTQMNLDILK